MKRALLLVGSPKPSGSASEAIGGYLLRQLGERGFETAVVNLHAAVRSDAGLSDLAGKVDESDVVVVATPLYVDSVPAPVVKAFEWLANRRRASEVQTRPALVAIVNSGLPETFQSDTAVEICRLFARDAHFAWAGGFRVGGGGAVGSGTLKDRGGLTRRLTAGLQLAATALASGLPIPRGAFDLTDRPLMPVRLYTLIADLGMRWAAYRHGVLRRINDRPYTR
jgi:hypothetical protein